MAQIQKTIFISYRRTDVYTALAVYQDLTNRGYDVFFDYTSIPSGDFEQIIVSNIKARAHFVLILTPTALDRCNEPGDWLRREIEIAIAEQRNIVPLFFKGFNFGIPSVSEKLIGKLSSLSRYNGLNVHEDYFHAAMERLSGQFLNVPLDAVLHPLSTEVRKVVKEEQLAANDAILRGPKSQLTAEEKSETESLKPAHVATPPNKITISAGNQFTPENRPLRVFLSYSSDDKMAVRELYQQLRAEPWIQPWLDEEELYPGQNLDIEIEKAVEAADAILVCLTKASITKEGYVQRELRAVLDLADYKPEGTLFIIPIRLEECEPPRRLQRWQSADYFAGSRDRAFQRLLVSLKRRAESLGLEPGVSGGVGKQISLSTGGSPPVGSFPKAHPRAKVDTEDDQDDAFAWLEALAAKQAEKSAVSQKEEKTDYSELGLSPPITQVISTYVMGDDLYDESFSIDTTAGEFLGEFGVGVTETIGVGSPRKVTALEVWLFDKNDIKTPTKLLLSEFAFHDASLRFRLEAKGELVQIQQGTQVLIETTSLQLLVTIVEMTYATGLFQENRVFERVTLELAVWPRR